MRKVAFNTRTVIRAPECVAMTPWDERSRMERQAANAYFSLPGEDE
jgi:hypothetical protein